MISEWCRQRSIVPDRKTPVQGTGTTVLASNILIVVSLLGGMVEIGQTITGPGIPNGTTVTGFLTGLGGIGTYTLSASVGIGFGTGAITLTLP